MSIAFFYNKSNSLPDPNFVADVQNATLGAFGVCMTTGVDDIDWVGLGQVLCEAREAGRLSLESMSKELCLSKTQIRALECGSAAPFLGDTVRSWCARRYAILLGLDWDHLAQSLRSEERDAAIGMTNFTETSSAKPISAGASAKFRIGLLLGAVVLTLITVIAISANG